MPPKSEREQEKTGSKEGLAMSEMIRAEHLTYEYVRTVEEEKGSRSETVLALNDVTLTIPKGAFVAVLGHNGSGKSTFAKEINALLKPTKGVLWVDGMDTSDDELLWEIRQSAGMVFQNPDNQIVATVVEEDVAFGPENLGVEPEEIRRRVDQALETVGMTAFRKDTPSKLSGGQKQRIAIAGVLAMEPECIVLDEPTAMLDPMGRKDVIETIHRLNKEKGITIVLITHYMEETVDADWMVIIDDGKVAMEGTPREVFSQVEKVKGVGLDVSQATELAYRLRQMGLAVPKDILTTEEMVGALCQLQSTM